MANKYANLIKPLSSAFMGRAASSEEEAKGKFANGPGNADNLVWLNGRDHLDKAELNFTWGFYSGIGDWHTGQDPHIHPYPECLVFVGLDSANVDYLGAEVDICLGEEQETYTFDDPTCVIAPAGFPHCPLITKRVLSPKGYGFFLISLGANPDTTWMGDGITAASIKEMEEQAAKEGRKMPMTSRVAKNQVKKAPAPSTGKYQHLLKPFKPQIIIERGELKKENLTAAEAAFYEKSELGPGNADHQMRLGDKNIEGLGMHFSWGFHSSPGLWFKSGESHAHPYTEIQVFAGIDPTDIDYLGAEIEIELGEERERHIITKPSAIVCPAGMPHHPIVTRWVDKPFASYTIGLDNERKATIGD